MIAYCGLVIGILLGGFGFISGLKEKNDTEQRKIYLIAGAIGLVVAIVSLIVVLK